MIVHADVAVRRAGLNEVTLAIAGVTLRPMPRLLRVLVGSRVQAITLNRVIFVESSRFSAVVAGQDPGLLVHELTHVAQWADNGAVPFLARYVWEYLRFRTLGISHNVAYRAISFEHIAFAKSRAIEGRPQ